jgi:hypothetical protein
MLAIAETWEYMEDIFDYYHAHDNDCAFMHVKPYPVLLLSSVGTKSRIFHNYVQKQDYPIYFAKKCPSKCERGTNLCCHQ